ncbi:histidine phosphatase family protein [Paludibacterium paludis]|uniref:Phosphoglycerate mutase n=1 Tax=Paludibacterium paludis TaxID=1225769 RepID=A0A918NYY6_9NEIS|nr:histidine phosphatase family protein [Paludibacterium paludis]GGY05320.1 phosphoglycerate mutase [Paludibacterium paludis]
MEVILVRHPRALNAAGRCYGRLDLIADPAALAESAARLAALRGLPVLTSPARRCRALAARLAPAPRVLPELAELDFGRWEGLPWDAIARDELDAWAADPWRYAPGGGESPLALLARWRAAARRLSRIAAPRIVVVTHAGIIRAALHEAGLIDADAFLSLAVEHDFPYRVER